MNVQELNRFLNTFEALTPRTKALVRDKQGRTVVGAISRFIGSGERSRSEIMTRMQLSYSPHECIRPYVKRLLELNTGLLYEEFTKDGKIHYRRIIQGDLV